MADARYARIVLQDYQHVAKYIPDALWESLSPNTSQQFKLDQLLSFVSKLGLRYPSEPTYRVLTSIWLLSCHGFEEAFAMPPLQKFQMVIFVKSFFKKMMPPIQHEASEFANGLPNNTEDFQMLYLKTWQAAFGSDVPGRPRFSEMDIMRVGINMPLRASSTWVKHDSETQLCMSRSSRHVQSEPQLAMNPNSIAGHICGQLVVALQSSGILPNAGQRGINLQVLKPPSSQTLTTLALTNQASSIASVSLNALQHDGSPPAQLQSSGSNVVQPPASGCNVVQPSETLDPPLSIEDKQGPFPKEASSRTDRKDVLEASSELVAAIESRKKGGTKVIKRPASAGKAKSETKAKKACPKQIFKAAQKKKEAKKVKASFSHEASRLQLMCRTGLDGPGQCFAIKYNSSKGSFEAARKQAQKWLADQ